MKLLDKAAYGFFLTAAAALMLFLLAPEVFHPRPGDGIMVYKCHDGVTVTLPAGHTPNQEEWAVNYCKDRKDHPERYRPKPNMGTDVQP